MWTFTVGYQRYSSHVYFHNWVLVQTTVHWPGMFWMILPPECIPSDSCRWQWSQLLFQWVPLFQNEGLANLHNPQLYEERVFVSNQAVTNWETASNDKQHLTVADRCLSRPLPIGLACSDWSSNQNVSPLTAVGGSGAKGGPCQYHSTKAGVWKFSTINNCIRRECSVQIIDNI